MEKRLCKACSESERRGEEATRASNNKKTPEQIKLTNDCPAPCTMPYYAHTHTWITPTHWRAIIGRERVRAKRAKPTPFIKCLQTANISLLNNSQIKLIRRTHKRRVTLFSVYVLVCCCVRVVVLKINLVVWRQAGLQRACHLENFQMFRFGAFSFCANNGIYYS